jgi:hypothetical protein
MDREKKKHDIKGKKKNSLFHRAHVKEKRKRTPH